MAGMADLLFPQAETSQVPEAAFWKSWYPSVPYTGSLEQQREVTRLRDMQDQNMASTISSAPETSQGAVANQNAQVMQQPVVGGQMAPLQAVGNAPVQPAVQDLAGQMAQIPVQAPMQNPQTQVPNAQPSPTLAKVLPGQAGQESLASILQPSPQAQPSQPPSMAPPAAPEAAPQGQPQQPDVGTMLTSPTTPPQSKWKIMLEQLQKPEVAGPLQTFFSALAAPLAPWETMGSRLGRASSLMQMHKGMLAQNIADVPREEQMKDLAVRGKTAEVTTKEIQAQVAESLKDTTVAKALQDLDNARIDGDSKLETLAGSKLKNRLVQLYGDEKAAAEIFQILSGVAAQQRTVATAERNAGTNERRADIAEKALASKGKLSDLPDAEAAARINAYAQAFRDTGAATQEGMDQITWLTNNKVDVDDFLNTIAKLQSKGIKVQWGTQGKAAGAAGTNDPLGLRK